jgi:excinuclease ABC subunit C
LRGARNTDSQEKNDYAEYRCFFLHEFPILSVETDMNPEKFSEDFIRLKNQVKETPLDPGVYIMRDGDGQVIYIGKAKSLRKRLGSYFSGEKDIKTRTLLTHVRTIETIIVSNEYEALLLENTLIKEHSPKYNINLKDGKTYPVVRLTKETFPRVFKTRRIVEDGSLYFGPFPNVQAVDTLLELIDKLFPLRKCRRLRPRKNPCVYYHMGRCSAPCCGKISPQEYGEHVDQVIKLLSGETEVVVEDLRKKMREAAQAFQYEWAAQLRDAITAIGELSVSNAVVDFDADARDYIAWASEGVLTTFTILSMRGGKMTGRELYRTRSAATEGESVELFLTTYYNGGRLPPPRVYLSVENLDVDPIHRWFSETLGQNATLLGADEKRHQAVLAMALQNAQEDLAKRVKERGAGPALDELARLLGLRRRPERIEGFDIAQLDGAHPVASLVSFKGGIPDKKNYRYFKLRTVEGRVDDFDAMREAVSRRYSRLLADDAELPDLVLIDGGIGQVNAAKGVLDVLGLDCDVVGLAKRDEELWLPGARDPIRLDKRSEALKILQFLRDETHRFATTLNQKLRSKDLKFPALQSVEGVGPQRAAAVMRAYQSLEAIASADPVELAARCRLGESIAQAIVSTAKITLADRAADAQRLASGRRRGSPQPTAYPYASSSELGASLAAEAAEPASSAADSKK